MNVLVTGASGQLGREIQNYSANLTGAEFYFTDSSSVDVANSKQVEAFVAENKITVIVNCAAYTAVDLAESEVERAEKVNSIGPKLLGEIAEKKGIKVIHISTDFVFDGKANSPYQETDETNPLSVYGKTKLNGEQNLFETCPSAIVIRTSWLYSSFGKNFMNTMVRLGKTKESLSVVSDQFGAPTWTKDLVAVIFEFLKKNQKGENLSGIYHYSNAGAISWFDFASEIMNIARLDCKTKPIPTQAYPTPAVRPKYSVLDTSKVQRDLSITVPNWRVSLKNCLQELSNASASIV